MIWLIGLISLCIGSFLTVVVNRLPRILQAHWNDQSLPLSLYRPRSHCPHCQKTLSAAELIPLLSFLYLKGRCRQCHHPISLHYGMIELLSLGAGLTVAFRYPSLFHQIPVLVFSFTLIALSFIDLKTHLLPDHLTLSLLWLGLLLSPWQITVSSQDAIFGASVGYVSLQLIARGYEKFRHREGLGLGDSKLLAALGAWVGWEPLPVIVCGASILGLLVVMINILLKRQTADDPIAFGPFLAISGWIFLIVNRY